MSPRTKRDATTCDRKKHARTTAGINLKKVMKKKPFVIILFSPFSLSQFQQGWAQTFQRRIMSQWLFHCVGLREIAMAVGTTYEGYFRAVPHKGATTHSIMTLSINYLFVTSCAIMLGVAMLNVVMLSVVLEKCGVPASIIASLSYCKSPFAMTYPLHTAPRLSARSFGKSLYGAKVIAPHSLGRLSCG